MTTRPLGDREVSALGFGCWAIGGPFSDTEGKPLGWGEVDDDESVAAIHAALDLGVTFFDTADVYGAGRSERVLGRALGKRRDEVVIASKWGNVFDEDTKVLTGTDQTVEYMNRAIRATLTRLGTDHLDLYQLHTGPTVEEAAPLADAAEDLVKEGLILGFAWSTDDPERAAAWAGRPGHVAVQHELSVLHDAPEILDLCERHGLASVNRTPLAMGLLGRRDGSRPATGADIRSAAPEWLRFFSDGVPTAEWAAVVDGLRDILTSDGRTLAQGALAWLWARSGRTIPIPGFRNVTQAKDNAGALAHGPLRPEQMAEVARLLHG
ncbi:aldo/keto reductase [Actinophytocola algeriensis]|uniref:Aryl-alcohol dehydrogenase-like predicted oxidoreductase n=1 Tax=Actinophytocola algeriensis TaxID=1768010 RepID=A0A7W7Q2J7_9PSEU|nr:aldo/keto reductase [Actinophytocola algeriensis]MBB4905723.1 aryl-alcohol dehydrogenase-like predicted oxidoreductase [Actinophytocola algeriensis]MBE1472592.1 aryl-alcohol dehydrogenase-like predicted oxidoreductase [Actinophytocola algeriensis]